MINLKHCSLFFFFPPPSTACDIVLTVRSISKVSHLFLYMVRTFIPFKSPPPSPNGAFHHLDRSLALDGFIHLLMHKVISVIFFSFPAGNIEEGKSVCLREG